MTTESPFVILDVPNKGQSVFAVRFIPAGTSLFQEPPIITVEDAQATAKIISLNRAFSQLSAEQKTVYLGLCNSQPTSDTALTEEDVAVLGIWKTNTFVLDDQGVINGIFQMSSRLNHSCLGGENAHWEWSNKERLMRFWTDRDIEAGEEITHCYRPDWRMGTKNRREALMENYGFWCTCIVCEGPEED